MLRSYGPEVEKGVKKLLRSLGADKGNLSEEQRGKVLESVSRLEDACGGLPDDWKTDISVMLGRTRRETVDGLLSALEECIELGGMYRGAEWASEELLQYVVGSRAAHGLPSLTERQRAALTDRVGRACERSGGRMATHWMRTVDWMATEGLNGNDTYIPLIRALDYCVRHGGLDAPNGQAVMEGYLGPAPESNPDLVMMRIAREASAWLGGRQLLPEGMDGYTWMLDLLRASWSERGALDGENWGGGENSSIWFGCEWIRLVSDGSEPVPALLWLHSLDGLKVRMGDGSDEWLSRISPVSMREDDRVFTLEVDDPSDARFVMERWGTVIEAEIARQLGRGTKVEIWDDDSNVWSPSAA